MRVAVLSMLMFLPSLAVTAGPVAQFIDQAHQKAVQSQPAANQGLETMRQLAALEADDPFGLPAAATLPPAAERPLQPQPTYEVDLLKLRSYQPAADPTGLLSLADTRRVLYLVKTPTMMLSVEVRQKEDDEWVTFRLGQSSYAGLVASTIKDLQLTPQQTILVEIPALQLRFIGFARQNPGEVEVLMLAAVNTAPEFGIIKAQARPAREVLAALVDEARSHDGQPT